MNIKRWIPILVGIVLISFGVGIFSLIYNDNFSFSKTMSGQFINIVDKNEIVRIGPGGIEVKDGKSHVEISWKGIRVRDGKDLVDISWNGIRVDEDGKNKVNIGGNWSRPWPNDLKWEDVDVEEYIDINEVDNIRISTPFIPIKVTEEDRDDVKILYYGTMKTNVVPKYKFEKISKETINIDFTLSNNSYSITNSDVLLEVFVPRKYKGNFDVNSISGDIYLNHISGEEFIISSTSGNIELENLNSNRLQINTTSGDIEIDNSTGELLIETTSGNVYLDNKDMNENMKLISVSGDISIKLSDRANYTITGKTTSGDFISNIHMSTIESSRNSFKAVIGSGEKSLEINTTSGNIYFN